MSRIMYTKTVIREIDFERIRNDILYLFNGSFRFNPQERQTLLSFVGLIEQGRLLDAKNRIKRWSKKYLGYIDPEILQLLEDAVEMVPVRHTLDEMADAYAKDACKLLGLPIHPKNFGPLAAIIKSAHEHMPTV